MSTGNLVSPNEMLEKAKEFMLAGREPQDFEDWSRVINFVAFNTAQGVELEVCNLFAVLFDIPLLPEDVAAIVKYQQDLK
jgi:hypothetical protein